MESPTENDEPAPSPALSKNARKKLLKQQRQEERKAARKAAEKERKRADLERRRREWDEKLAGATEEERVKLVEERKEARKERMGKRTEERDARAARLRLAAEEGGQKVVIDLEFADLMSPGEIQSLVHQILYCYAVNGRCASPAHLWLTGCGGEIGTHLQRIPGFDKWIIEKENRSYLEALQDKKENLVYLTADSENVLDELDPKQIYIIGGLVDRNRWKGITMKKASDQGIQTAKLPIANYLKMSSSQVLTVNQVVEILLKFLETRDWKDAFFHVIPQRKRGGVEIEIAEAEDEDAAETIRRHVEQEEDEEEEGGEEELTADGGVIRKKQRTKEAEGARRTEAGEEDEAADVEGRTQSTKQATNGMREES